MVKNRICAIVNLTEDSSKLKPLTDHRPIAALPFAGRYRLIDIILSDISYAGIDSVGLFIGESGRSIYDHVRSGSAWHLQSYVRGGIFTFSHQNWKRQHHLEDKNEDFYYNHRLFMERSKANYVFITGSKIIANVDINAIRQTHQANDADITVVYKNFVEENLKDSDRLSNGIVFDENDNIKEFTDTLEPNENNRVNASLNMFFLTIDKMNQIIDRAISDGVYLELNELIQHYIGICSLNAYEYTGYAANIDTIDKYFNANMEMLNYTTLSSLFKTSIPILTKSKHGSPAYYADGSKVTQSLVGTDSYIAGEVNHSVLNRRVDIKEGAKIDHSIILQGTKVGENAQIEYAIVDKNTIIEPGAKLIGKPNDIIVVSKGSRVYAE